jgi:hypothetical protein
MGEIRKSDIVNGDVAKYADYITDAANNALQYCDYLVHINLSVKDFIVKYHDKAMSETIRTMSPTELEEYAALLNDMITFQEITAGKLDKLIGTLDKDLYNDFREAYMDEQSALKKYKRDVKINKLTDGD